MKERQNRELHNSQKMSHFEAELLRRIEELEADSRGVKQSETADRCEKQSETDGRSEKQLKTNSRSEKEQEEDSKDVKAMGRNDYFVVGAIVLLCLVVVIAGAFIH